jgi:hypothetical protein
MKNEKNKNLKRVSKTSLSEKQSVRTTFKLIEDCINAIDWLLKTNNLKPKELFDFICSNNDVVNIAAEAAKKDDKNISVKHIRKTFVISKQTLRLLNKKSEEQTLSRDLIVEKLVLLFKVLLEKDTEKEKQKEEEALSIIDDFWTKAEEIEIKLKHLLYDDNPIINRFGIVIIILMHLVNAIESKLSNDVPIDPDDFSQG